VGYSPELGKPPGEAGSSAEEPPEEAGSSAEETAEEAGSSGEETAEEAGSSGEETPEEAGSSAEASVLKEPRMSKKARKRQNQKIKKRKLLEKFIERKERKDLKQEEEKDQLQTSVELTDQREELLKRQRVLEQENAKLKDSRMCKICLDLDVRIVFLPCRHLVSCEKCAPSLTKCPMCRKFIQGSVHAFVS